MGKAKVHDQVFPLLLRTVANAVYHKFLLETLRYTKNHVLDV